MSQLINIRINTNEVPLFKYALRELEMDLIECKESSFGGYLVSFEVESLYTLISIGKMIGVKIGYDLLREPAIKAYNEVKKIIDDATSLG